MTPSPALPARWAGALGATGALVLLALVVSVAALAPSPWWALGLSTGLALGAVAWKARHPLVLPAAMTMGTLALAGNTPGLTAAEVGFVAAYGVFLVWFYGTRIVALGGLHTHHATDRAFALFLVGVGLGVVSAGLYGGEAALLANTLGALSMMALYFPVREAALRHPRGFATMTVAFFVVCGGVALYNLMQYQALLAQHVLAEFVAGRRVTSNDVYFGGGFAVSLAFVMRSQRRRVQLGALVLLAAFVGALVATQARGQWVTCAVSAAALFVLGGARGRTRLLWAALVVVAGAAVLVPTLLGDKAMVIAEGMLRRFSTIGSATTQDISLLSRFVEAREVLPFILRNPVLGYGTAVTFPHYDIITQEIWNTTYVHVGYLGVLYSFGLWGAAVFAVAWGGSLRRSLRLYRAAPESTMGTLALGASAFFIGLFVLMTVANPLVTLDGLFVFAMLSALVSAGEARLQGLADWQRPILPAR